MEFKDNFSEILLIAEAPVIFYADDPYLIKTVDLVMKLPTIRETLTNPHIQLTLTLFQMPIPDLKKIITGMEFVSLFDMLIKLNGLQPGNQICRNMVYYLEYAFGAQFVEDDAKFHTWTINGIKIDELLFNRIAEITIIAAGLKEFGDQSKFHMDKPQWLIDKENEIKRIKNQC